MPDEPRFQYGLSTELFVTRKPGGESLLVGGIGADAERWTRVLTHRAAQVLWFHLTQLLFPEQSDQATAAVMTAPIRDSTQPTITTHMSVEKIAGQGYEMIGWASNRPVWRVLLSDEETQRFWTALDIALYPAGQNKKPDLKQ